jgi:hypothetical protein
MYSTCIVSTVATCTTNSGITKSHPKTNYLVKKCDNIKNKSIDRPRTRTWNLLIRSQVRYPITPAGQLVDDFLPCPIDEILNDPLFFQRVRKNEKNKNKSIDRPRTRTWNLLIRSQVRYPITPAGQLVDERGGVGKQL